MQGLLLCGGASREGSNFETFILKKFHLFQGFIGKEKIVLRLQRREEILENTDGKLSRLLCH